MHIQISANTAEAKKSGRGPYRTQLKSESKPGSVIHSFEYRYPENKRVSEHIKTNELNAVIESILLLTELKCDSMRTRSIDSVAEGRAQFSIVGFDLTEKDLERALRAVDRIMVKLRWTFCRISLIQCKGTASILSFDLNEGRMPSMSKSLYFM